MADDFFGTPATDSYWAPAWMRQAWNNVWDRSGDLWQPYATPPQPAPYNPFANPQQQQDVIHGLPGATPSNQAAITGLLSGDLPLNYGQLTETPKGMPASAPGMLESMQMYGVAPAQMGFPPPSGAPAPMGAMQQAGGMLPSGGALEGFTGPKLTQERLPRFAPPTAVAERQGPTQSLKGDLDRSQRADMVDNPFASGAPAQAAAPGAAPAQPQSQGPLGWRDLATAIVKHNPGIKPAVVLATLERLQPIMHADAQNEFKLLQQQYHMQAAQLGLERAYVGLETARAKAGGKGGLDVKQLAKEYHEANTEREQAARTLALNPGSKEAKTVFADATKRWEAMKQRFDAVYGAPGQAQPAPFTGFLQEKAKRIQSGQETMDEGVKTIMSALPQTVVSGLNSGEQNQLAVLLLQNPAKASEIIQRVQRRIAEPTTTTMSKSNGYN